MLLRNGAATIRESLHSVQRQSHPVDEIIVIDNGSSDDGLGIVQAMATDRRIRLIRMSAGTLAAARNAGVRAAHGDVVAFLDQGDRWHFDHIAVLINPFREKCSVEIGWSCADIAEIDANGSTARRHRPLALETPQPKRSLADCLGYEMLVIPSAAMVSRRAYWAVGGCNERLDTLEDDDLFTRLFHAGYANVHIGHPITARRRQRTVDADGAALVRSRVAVMRQFVEPVAAFPTSETPELRDAFARRFLKHFVSDARAAPLAGDAATASQCRDHITEVLRIGGRDGVARDDMLVSAVVPLRNDGASVVAMLESILRQSRPVDEIVVLDYGSTHDGAAQVRRMAQEARLRLIQEPCATRAAARNAGVRHACGELIAFLDAGHVWYPDHIKALLVPFLGVRSSHLGWTYATSDRIARNGSVLVPNHLGGLPGLHPKASLLDCLRNGMNIAPSTSLVSRQAYLAVGGCDETLPWFEDEDLFLRLLAGYSNDYVNRPLSGWYEIASSEPNDAEQAYARRRYLTKLIASVADESQQLGHNAHELIASYFLPGMLMDTPKAILAGTWDERREAISSLRLAIGRLPDHQRILLQVFLLPVLDNPLAARLLMRYRIAAFRLFRRILQPGRPRDGDMSRWRHPQPLGQHGN